MIAWWTTTASFEQLAVGRLLADREQRAVLAEHERVALVSARALHVGDADACAPERVRRRTGQHEPGNLGERSQECRPQLRAQRHVAQCVDELHEDLRLRRGALTRRDAVEQPPESSGGDGSNAASFSAEKRSLPMNMCSRPVDGGPDGRPAVSIRPGSVSDCQRRYVRVLSVVASPTAAPLSRYVPRILR